ncbi:hypothetical protein JOC77_001088 [Peribacillus deserti]|uniref:Phage protein n=1 Tax=Peribacillus deserti TaxID=673318 RepID=A0ABS2QEW4_9BACI|nr:hypothetical protein [Peribacillus deserti]MBM7691681.1 hypothetical protein [Peribacillus deserti]
MLKSGFYGKYQGIEYKIKLDMERNIKILTKEKAKTDETFKDAFSSGVYSKIVYPNELTDCVKIKTYGLIKGEKIYIRSEQNDMYLFNIGDWEIGDKLDLPELIEMLGKAGYLKVK